MGRRAPLTAKHPAERVYWKNGAFHYVDKQNKWHRLGEEWNREAKDRYARVSSSTPAEDTVAHMLASFMSHLRTRVANGDYSQETMASHAAEVGHLNDCFGHMQKASVKRSHIAAYLEKRCDPKGRPAPIRANREVSLLSAAYSYEIRKQRLDDNPCLGVPRNKEKPRDRYVEHWERRQFAKRCCPAWLRAYLLLKYLTGLRMGNMLRLSRANETKRGLQVALIKRRGGKRKVLEFKWTWALRRAVGFIHGLADNTIRAPGLPEPTSKVSSLTYFRGRSLQPLSASAFKSQWYRSMKQWKDMGNQPFTERDIRAKHGSDSKSLADAQATLGHDEQRTTSRHYRRGTQQVRPLR